MWIEAQDGNLYNRSIFTVIVPHVIRDINDDKFIQATIEGHIHKQFVVFSNSKGSEEIILGKYKDEESFNKAFSTIKGADVWKM